jgi:polysaccharide export outer membrane protein
MKLFFNLLKTWIFLTLSIQLAAQDIPEPQDIPAPQDISEVQDIPEPGNNYVLRPNDVISLAVFEEADLSKEVSISKNGMASFQLIGPVEIGGLTIKDAVAKIRDLYGRDYLRNPEMTLTISKYAPSFVTVIGQVKQPGSVAIPLGGKLDIGTALESVGGITDSANPNNILLVPTEGKSRVLSHKDIQGDLGRILLKPGDRIVVHESPFARSTYIVLGEVKNAGSFPLPKNGQLNLATALATAGGVGPFADANGVRLTKANGGTAAYSLKSINEGSAGKITIGAGDTVMVARNQFANTSVTMLGEVNRKGAITFPLDGRLDIMNAIARAGGFSKIANPKKVKITRNGKDYTVNTRELDKRPGGTVWLWPDDIVTVEESIF